MCRTTFVQKLTQLIAGAFDLSEYSDDDRTAAELEHITKELSDILQVELKKYLGQEKITAPKIEQ